MQRSMRPSLLLIIGLAIVPVVAGGVEAADAPASLPITLSNVGYSEVAVQDPQPDPSIPPTYTMYGVADADFTNATAQVAKHVEVEFDFWDLNQRSVGAGIADASGKFSPGIAIRRRLSLSFENMIGCPVPDESGKFNDCTATARVVSVDYADGTHSQLISFASPEPATQRRILNAPESPVVISTFGPPQLYAGAFSAAYPNVTFVDHTNKTATAVTVDYRVLATNGDVLLDQAHTQTGKFSPNIPIVSPNGLRGVISGPSAANGAIWHGYVGGQYVATITAQVIAVTYADGTKWTAG